MTAGSWRSWAAVLALALLPVVVVGVRAVRTASAELAAGQVDEAEGNTVRAIAHYRRAMRWTFPFNPYPNRAAIALRELAGRLEDERDTAGALLAWRSIAGSAAATRSFWAGESSARNEAVDAIVRLSEASESDARVASPPISIEAFTTTGSAWWGTVLLLGFAGWIAGLWLTASRGFDAAGRPRWASVRAPLAAALVGFALFVVGMLFA